MSFASSSPDALRGSGSAPHTRLVAEAIARAKRGDREGLHFLYVTFASDVMNQVRSILVDHHEAEDVTQNVFAKLMTVIGKYESREVPFEAWLRRVARNAALDHVRARRATPCEEIRLSDDEQGQIRSERGSALLTALDSLPPDQREVVLLRHVVGLSPSEIASTLGRTESSVHGLHHRGRLELQTALRRAGAAPLVRGTRDAA